MTASNNPVPVERVDREAAQGLWAYMQAQGPIVNAEAGRAIGREMLQAFARHRIAATPPELAATAGAAMREALEAERDRMKAVSEDTNIEDINRHGAFQSMCALKRVLAALPADQPPAAQAPAIPAGMALVPVVPTQEMIRACDGEDDDAMVARGRAVSAWSAMLSAAPKRAAPEHATALGEGREAGWTYEYDSGAGWETHVVLNTPPNLPTKRAPAKHYGSPDIRNIRPFFYSLSTPPRRVDDAGLIEALRERADVACDAECNGGIGRHEAGCQRATAILATHAAPAADHGAEGGR